MSNIPKLLTAADLVELGVFSCAQTAAEARYSGRGPKFLKLGEGRTGRIRYREQDVLEWLATRERTTTGESPVA